MLHLRVRALIAGDFAAPAEATAAVDRLVELHGGVAATAAHYNTSAVLLVTATTLRAQTSQSSIRLAKRRTFLGVDESLAQPHTEAPFCGRQAFAVVARRHLDGLIEADPQSVADLAKPGHPAPARANGARAGEAVTLAGELHVSPDSLGQRESVVGR